MRSATWVARELAVALWCRLSATQGQFVLMTAALRGIVDSDVLGVRHGDIDTVAARSETPARARVEFLTVRREKKGVREGDERSLTSVLQSNVAVPPRRNWPLPTVRRAVPAREAAKVTSSRCRSAVFARAD